MYLLTYYDLYVYQVHIFLAEVTSFRALSMYIYIFTNKNKILPQGPRKKSSKRGRFEKTKKKEYFRDIPKFLELLTICRKVSKIKLMLTV